MIVSPLLSALASCAPAQDLLQPTVVHSPSGEYALEVDPTNRFGRGSANYRMTRDGLEVWAGERPFSLWDSIVTDRGVVAGFAYTTGPETKEPAGEFEVIELGERGETMLLEAHARESQRVTHTTNVPYARGQFVQEELDRFVLRVCAGSAREEWWSYRLSTGEAIEHAKPQELLGTERKFLWSIDVEPLPGTSCTLAQWSALDTRDDRVALVDQNWRPLWSIDLVGQRSEQDDVPAILAADASGFSLRLAQDKSVVWFGIDPEPSESSGWAVREIGREAHPEEMDRDRGHVRDVALTEVASVPLVDGPSHVGLIFVDQLARIFIEDERTATIHVFGSEGRESFACSPEPGDFLDRGNVSAVSVTNEGNILLRVWTNRWVAFDARGNREGVVLLGGSHIALSPRQRWGVTQYGVGIALYEDGKFAVEEKLIERRSDRHWFREVSDISVAPDGTLAALDVPVFKSKDSEFAIALFTADGSPTSTFELPKKCGGRNIDNGGKWILMSDRRPKCFLVSKRDGSVRRFSVGEGEFANYGRAFLASGERELWWIQRDPLTLHRYALPE